MRYFGNHSMLKSIRKEIDSFNSRENHIATYVIICDADMPLLLKEMTEADMVPAKGMPFQLYGLRLIRTNDISQGMFAISGE
ncbi:hypothetical protein [Maribellus mangrovi]|uniref:hypothetical protein n=1 Tax=Maribellus mangrovi TaxID=3133146 RepID=UPI0030ED9915